MMSLRGNMARMERPAVGMTVIDSALHPSFRVGIMEYLAMTAVASLS